MVYGVVDVGVALLWTDLTNLSLRTCKAPHPGSSYFHEQDPLQDKQVLFEKDCVGGFDAACRCVLSRCYQLRQRGAASPTGLACYWHDFLVTCGRARGVRVVHTCVCVWVCMCFASWKVNSCGFFGWMRGLCRRECLGMNVAGLQIDPHRHRWKSPGLQNTSEPIFGQGIRRSTFQWKKRVFSEEGGGIQWMRGLVRISTGKAIQWRGPGHSVNRRTPKIEKLLTKSTSQKSAPKSVTCSTRRQAWHVWCIFYLQEFLSCSWTRCPQLSCMQHALCYLCGCLGSLLLLSWVKSKERREIIILWEGPELSGTESAILNRESSDSESCDSKVAVSIERMRFEWRFRIDFLRFYFLAIRLIFSLLAAEFLAIPGPRFRESCDSRFAILCH